MRTQDYFIFDGVDSRTFDALVFENDTLSTPVKDVTTTVIPGRNGDFILPNKRFGNVRHVYDVIIYRRFEQNYEDLRNFLLSRDGYCRLEDNIHPGEFYHAHFSEAIKPTLPPHGRDMGKFQLVFSRKPQRWLKSGEEEIAMLSNNRIIATTLNNPTLFGCYPLLKMTLTAEGVSNGFRLYVGNNLIDAFSFSGDGASYLTDASYPLHIDMETSQAYIKYDSSTTYYFGTTIKYTVDSQYPYMLRPGDNQLEVLGGTNWVSSLKVIPRWYII